MKHEYGYNGTAQYADYLELEDNLNFAIHAYDSDYLSYYLIVYTDKGITSMLEYGPLSEEADIVPEESTIKYSKFEVDEDKVDKAITKFLSSKKKLHAYKDNPFDRSKYSKIIEVTTMTVQDALDYGINLFDFMRIEMGIAVEKEICSEAQ